MAAPVVEGQDVQAVGHVQPVMEVGGRGDLRVRHFIVLLLRFHR